MSSWWSPLPAFLLSATVTLSVVTAGVVSVGTTNSAEAPVPNTALSSDTAFDRATNPTSYPTSSPTVTLPTPTDTETTDTETTDTETTETADTTPADDARAEAVAQSRAQSVATADAAAQDMVRAVRQAIRVAEKRAEVREKERKARLAAERKARRKARALAEELRKNPPVKTPFTVASFNALGASHTEGPGCNRCDWTDSGPRTRWAVEMFRTYDLDVVGLQEFQPAQQRLFSRLMPNWGVWGNSDNHVAWDRAKFEFVSGSTFTIPYFGGQPREMPVVRLRSLASGQEMVFISVHNVADTRGPAQHLRDEATRREVDVVTALRNEDRPAPVFMLGDMNDREDFFCPFTANGHMHNAGGGTHTDGVCAPPTGEGMGIDWVLGSTGVEFSGFARVWDGVANRISDHPLVLARVG